MERCWTSFSANARECYGVAVLGVLMLSAATSNSAQAQQTLELGGLYQGENLLVVNDPSADGVGFCCYEVRVNGMLTSDAVNSHAFEVDLGALGLTLGKGLSVRLKHRSGCVPRVLNPEVIQPIPGFQLVSFDAAPTGEVSWVTVDEHGRMPFVLQQFKWGKWVDVVRLDGRGGPEERAYSTVIQPIQGKNLLRLTHLAPDGTLEVKGEAVFEGDVPEVTMSYSSRSQVVTFSKATQYELVDEFGTVVLRGVGNQATLRYLSRGDYFVNFGAGTEVLKKR
ncbi:MAG: hypothetical protein L7S67_08080 [Flavobacteriales bacterium]|nr:hypothetical protein [Flavobacteriales bacterium]